MHVLLARENLPPEADHRTDKSLDPHIERDRDRRGCDWRHDERGSAYAAGRASLLDHQTGIGQFSDEHANRASVEPRKSHEVGSAGRTADMHPAQDSRKIITAHLVLRCC